MKGKRLRGLFRFIIPFVPFRTTGIYPGIEFVLVPKEFFADTNRLRDFAELVVTIPRTESNADNFRGLRGSQKNLVCIHKIVKEKRLVLA